MIHIIHSRIEAINKATVVSKVHHLAIQKQKATRQTNILNKEQPTHSKFKFQIQIARKRTQGSERCYAPRPTIDNQLVTYPFNYKVHYTKAPLLPEP